MNRIDSAGDGVGRGGTIPTDTDAADTLTADPARTNGSTEPRREDGTHHHPPPGAFCFTMAGKSGVWVFYYLQGEDGDSVENPNAFNVRRQRRERAGREFSRYSASTLYDRAAFRFISPMMRVVLLSLFLLLGLGRAGGLQAKSERALVSTHHPHAQQSLV